MSVSARGEKMKFLTTVLFLGLSFTAAATDIYTCSSNYGDIIITEDDKSLSIDCSRFSQSQCIRLYSLGDSDYRSDTVSFVKPMTEKVNQGYGRKHSIKNTPKSLKIVKKGVVAFLKSQTKLILRKDKLTAEISYGEGLLFPGGDKLVLECLKSK